MTTNEFLHETKGQWTDSFVLDGKKYYCNEVNPHPVHRTGGIIVDLGSDECATSDVDSHIIIMPERSEWTTLTFAVYTINQYTKPVTDDGIVVGIYRKGQPEPVRYKEYLDYKDDLLETLDDYLVEPGEYFLAMGNIAPYDHLSGKFEKTGNFYVYRIKIMEHGQHTQHPILLGANIDNDLLLNLMFHHDKDITAEHLSCECYDMDFRMLTDMQTISCLDVLSNSTSVQLKRSGWWIDGDYHVIVYHNKEPFAHVHFITQDGENKLMWTNHLTKEDIFYKLCKDVQKSGKKHMFCKLSGCGKLKKKVLDYLCGNHVHTNEHLMLAAAGKPEFDVMFHISGVLHPLYGYQTFTVKELMDEAAKVNDPQETLDAMMARRSTIIHELDELTKPNNVGFARMLMDIAADRHGFIVLYGTVNELKRVLNIYPQ